MHRIATYRDLDSPGCHPTKPAAYQPCLDNPHWQPKVDHIFLNVKLDMPKPPSFGTAFGISFGRGLLNIANFFTFGMMSNWLSGNNYNLRTPDFFSNPSLRNSYGSGQNSIGNLLNGGGYGYGYGGSDSFSGSTFDLAHTWGNAVPRGGAAVAPDNTKKTPEGEDKNKTGQAEDPDKAKKKAQADNGNGNVKGNQDGNQNGTVDKTEGNALFNAVNDKKADGTTDQIYSGVFASTTNTNKENGATLKQDDATRGKWHKGSATDATEADFKDAVRLGKAQGGTDDDKKADDKTGAPKYFTMTDYRSGNEYTFKLIESTDGKIQYKLDIAGSNLTHDNAGINGKNWEFTDEAKNLVFDVNVDASSSEIKLSYQGQKVSFDKLAQQG